MWLNDGRQRSGSESVDMLGGLAFEQWGSLFSRCGHQQEVYRTNANYRETIDAAVS